MSESAERGRQYSTHLRHIIAAPIADARIDIRQMVVRNAYGMDMRERAMLAAA